VDESIDYQEFDFTSFRLGFQKAFEILNNKFSEEDMKNLFAKTLENSLTSESHTRMISDLEYRHFVMDELYGKLLQSLQQNSWNVEVIMDRIPADLTPSGWDVFPKLDEQGCLILKRKI
jgi:putative heme iron utilization protein